MSETKIKGMGAIPHAGRVGFRVWATHAERVSVIGSFNGWNSDKHPMKAEENGYWYADLAEAHVGDQYKFLLTTAMGDYKRIGPYAREVTSSVGNAIVHDKSFDWEGDNFHLATRSPSTGIKARSSTASFGCTATSSGCGSTAPALHAASAGSSPRSIT
jgi:1,4-alpha-glucan branching enzyme